MSTSEAELHVIAHWVASCAARALPLFEAESPNDRRPRDAIHVTRAFSKGGRRTAKLRSVSEAALASASEASDPVTVAAARAAGLAAACAYMDETASPPPDILEPVALAAHACELDADAQVIGDEEIEKAIEEATPALRAIVRRMPPRSAGEGRLDELMFKLDTALRQR